MLPDLNKPLVCTALAFTLDLLCWKYVHDQLVEVPPSKYQQSPVFLLLAINLADDQLKLQSVLQKSLGATDIGVFCVRYVLVNPPPA